MRQKRFYSLAFLLVLAGAIVAARVVYDRVGPVQVPGLDSLAGLPAALEDLNLAALLPRPNPAPAATPTPEPTVAARPTPVDDATTAGEAPAAPTAEETAPPAVEATAPAQAEATASPELARPTATPAPPTPTPTSTPPSSSQPAFPFQPAAAVRHSTGDCPGPLIRGTVRDGGGNPLPGVRVWRYDQWGNEQTVTTKSGEADLGQYDFPLGDTPNLHYVQIVDGSGAPISPAVEVPHRQGDAADATCHTLDWVRNP